MSVLGFVLLQNKKKTFAALKKKTLTIHEGHNNILRLYQGCQIFLATKYQNGKNI
jgi:hypothetical protein